MAAIATISAFNRLNAATRQISDERAAHIVQSAARPA
jgi:hypothetical protein